MFCTGVASNRRTTDEWRLGNYIRETVFVVFIEGLNRKHESLSADSECPSVYWSRTPELECYRSAIYRRCRAIGVLDVISDMFPMLTWNVFAHCALGLWKQRDALMQIYWFAKMGWTEDEFSSSPGILVTSLLPRYIESLSRCFMPYFTKRFCE